MQLDGFDQKIIALLESDGRMSWRDLGEQVNLSASACQRRVQSLVASGAIRHFTLARDYQRLGYAVRAFVQVNISRHDKSVALQFRQAILDYPEVIACHKISGSVDFLLDVVAIDLGAFSRFIEDSILYFPGVTDASSSIVLEELKAHGQSIVV